MALTLVLNFIFHSTSYAQRNKKVSTAIPITGIKSREAEYLFIEGEKYFILDDTTKANFYFNRVLEMNPRNATIHYKIGEILSKSKDITDLYKSKTYAEEAINLDKKNKYFYLLATDISTTLNQYDKVAGTLELMLKEVPDSEDYLFELATAYSKSNKYEAAIETLNRAENYFGINEISSLKKQEIYFQIGKSNEAVFEAEKLMRAFPLEERFVINLANALIVVSKPNEAIELINKNLATNPDWIESKITLSDIYHSNGGIAESQQLQIQIFDDYFVDLQTKIEILQGYVSQFKKNNLTENNPDLLTFPESLLNKLKAQYPNQSEVYIEGGNLYFNFNLLKEAEREYLKAIDLKSTQFSLWSNLLSIEETMNQFDSLLIHTDHALEFHPNQPILYYYNGYGHFGKKEYEQAIQSLVMAKNISFDNPELVSKVDCLLGECYFENKEFEKSNIAFEESLSFNPNNDYVLNKYSLYLSLRKEKLSIAEEMAKRALDLQPTNVHYLETYALVLFNLEKYMEAKSYIEMALRLENQSPILYEHYGDILFMLNEQDNALIQWKKARTLPNFSKSLDKKITNRKIN